MRIAWFTPFGPRSAIGDYSETIVRRLAVEDEVTVFAPAGDGADAPRPFPLPVVPIPPVPPVEVLEQLCGFDLAVYNLGNHLHNHLSAYETAVRRPGVVVLHDLVLRDFFRGYFLLHRKDPAGFARFLRYAHGPEAEAHGRDVVEGRRHEDYDDPARLRFPLFKPALHRALGVVVHSEYARGRVAAEVPAPVRMIDFPRFGPTADAAPPRFRHPGGKVQVLTFGVLVPNKLVHAVVEAIAGSELLRRSVRYTAVGAEGMQGYEGRLRKRIDAHGLGEVVTLAGRLSDDELRAALDGADVVVNLRNPHCGESSASLLTSLVAGVPTVVWDHGFYAEFPDDVVVKVRSEAEIAGALERLAGDPGLRQRIGRTARAHALARFDTDRYCRQFREFAGHVRALAPVLALADTASDRLAELGSTDLDRLADRFAAEIAALVPEVPAAFRVTPPPADVAPGRRAAA